MGGSEVEGQLVEVDIRWDCTDFGAEASNLIGEHARSWCLDRIIPIVVVVAKSVGEVQDGHLRNLRGVFSHVEMSRLH